VDLDVGGPLQREHHRAIIVVIGNASHTRTHQCRIG
jgi:hypothetical protein